MRILHTADWHLGKTLEGTSRQAEQEAFVEELCSIVDREQIDAVLIAGDVFDTFNPPARAEELFYYALERLSNQGRRAVVAIAGNHDNPERLCAANPLAIRQGIVLLGLPNEQVAFSKGYGDGVQVVDAKPTYVALKIPGWSYPLEIGALPYPSEARLNQVLAQVLDENSLQQAYAKRIEEIWGYLDTQFSEDGACVVMSHLFMDGSAETGSERPIQVGGAYTVGRTAPSMAQYMALGHLHRAQNLREDVPIRYSGSPIAYSFSEKHQTKSVTLVDIKPKQPVYWEEIRLTAGKPLVRWEAHGLGQVIDWCEQQRDINAWVEVEVHTEETISAKIQQQIRKLHPGVLTIRPVYLRAGDKPAANRLELPLDQLFIDFYTQKTGGSKPRPEVVKLFLELVQEQTKEAAPEIEEVTA